VTSGMAMYDTMQYIKPQVSTVCIGQAASMGSLLLAAGAPGKRFSLPNSRIMIHQPSGGAMSAEEAKKFGLIDEVVESTPLRDDDKK